MDDPRLERIAGAQSELMAGGPGVADMSAARARSTAFRSPATAAERSPLPLAPAARKMAAKSAVQAMPAFSRRRASRRVSNRHRLFDAGSAPRDVIAQRPRRNMIVDAREGAQVAAHEFTDFPCR